MRLSRIAWRVRAFPPSAGLLVGLVLHAIANVHPEASAQAPSPAVAELAASLRQGLPDAAADQAIADLGALRDPAALDVLVEMLRHRRPSARVAAVKAIAQVRAPGVATVVASALRDVDATVRAAAAESLEEVGDAEVVPTLLDALERGVLAAARAIGRHARPADLDRFEALFGRVPLTALLDGYDRILDRRDVPAERKRAAVTRIGEIGSLVARRFLERRLAVLPAVDRDGLRPMLERAIARIRVPGEPREEGGGP